jgi:hypothetical protein
MTTTTIKTQIVVQFDDQFTDAANRAMENHKQSLKEAQRIQAGFSGNIFQEFSIKLAENESQIEELMRAQRARIDQFWTGLEDRFLERDIIDRAEAIAAFAGAVVLFSGVMVPATAIFASFYATWKLGEELTELRVGDKPFDEYLKVVVDSLENLASAKPLELQLLSPDISEQLSELERTRRLFEKQNKLFLHLNLVDNATEEARQLRQEIEAIYSQDIVQRIKVIEERSKLTIPSFSETSDSIFNDSAIDLQTSSLDLTGFSDSVSTSPSNSTTVPGFSSGIERVPRDMLAMIHKDEAVLPKNRAEDFRRGGSSGVSVQKLEFNIHAPNVLNLDRETVGDLALTIRDEIQRIDQRA